MCVGYGWVLYVSVPVVCVQTPRAHCMTIYQGPTFCPACSLHSAYRSHHSTETAVLRVLTDILYAVDEGDLSVLALLDLSAAFDTVDHNILMTRLRVSYGIRDAALDWLQSYLTGRMECVRRGTSRSTPTTVWYGAVSYTHLTLPTIYSV